MSVLNAATATLCRRVLTMIIYVISGVQIDTLVCVSGFLVSGVMTSPHMRPLVMIYMCYKLSSCDNT